MRRPATALALLLSLAAPAAALVGGAPVARDQGAGRHVVMIVSTRNNICTGTALARDLVLTAAHCVEPPATYRVMADGIAAPGLALASRAVHPRYDAGHYKSGRVTADVALLKLERPLPASVVPAPLAPDRKVAAGDRFTVAGIGSTAHQSETGIGVPRQAALVATGRPGNLQIRLMDPATRDRSAGLGACTGDSGGPAFVESDGRYAVIGVVSWSTGPAGSDGCGGLTGVTPLSLYRGWIAETAKKMGVALGR
ncbi:MAG: trypsin-like serine protease [Alphaproteobacteria bacterium]|nr:trypsin-like serine protease [Alphaproteobacteria bacterium]